MRKMYITLVFGLLACGCFAQTTNPQTNPGSAIEYLDRGNAFFASGRYPQAIADYTQAIALGNYDALINRGVAYKDQEKNNLAKADFGKAISLQPGSAGDAFFNLADMLLYEENYDDALMNIEKAVAVMPNNTLYLSLYSKTLLTFKRDNEGLAAAEKILILNPKHRDGFIYKATALNNLKRFDEAIATITLGINEYPDFYVMYGLRGFIYKMMGKTDLAEADNAKSRIKADEKVAASDLKELEGQDDECIKGNCITGLGTVLFPSGNKYVGSFLNRKRQGNGIFYFNNGDKFEGVFKSDLKDNGTYTFSNGYTYTGKFLNDDFFNGVFKAPSGKTVSMQNGKVVTPPAKLATDDKSTTCQNKVSCPHCHGKGIESKPIEQKLSWSTKDTYSVDRYGNRSTNYVGQSGGSTYSIPNYVGCGRCGGKGYICK